MCWTLTRERTRKNFTKKKNLPQSALISFLRKEVSGIENTSSLHHLELHEIFTLKTSFIFQKRDLRRLTSAGFPSPLMCRSSFSKTTTTNLRWAKTLLRKKEKSHLFIFLITSRCAWKMLIENPDCCHLDFFFFKITTSDRNQLAISKNSLVKFDVLSRSTRFTYWNFEIYWWRGGKLYRFVWI